MNRAPGLSVRFKLTISYAGFLILAGGVVLVAVGAYVLYGLPDGSFLIRGDFLVNRATIVRSFIPIAIVVFGFLLVFGLLGGWVLAGRMLGPLDRIARAARIASSGNLSHRIELEGHQDEFRELADTFDAMLARLEGQVAEQQRFAANASHELRTPLAITQTLLDVARNDPDLHSRELLERLYVVNARAIDLTEALLLLSRSDQRTFVRESVDLSLIAEEASETLLPLAEKHGVTIETAGEVASTVGSYALLLQLTTNLLHNAIVHNLPEGGSIAVGTAVAPGHVILTVENSGASLSPARVATLTEPFQRGSERARSHHTGVGLGLAIVKSIAQAHDGTLTLTPLDAGGLRVTVQLPAAPPLTTPDSHAIGKSK
ncbi:MAG: two-component system, OmpR family, sensor histidine kinase VanS [Actinomycetota bacterium]|nr:two-component system, OmpR family, sensor histidine kinase VanS [Actinomycetota bacterium]